MRRCAGIAALVGVLAFATAASAVTPTIDEFSSGLPTSADPIDITAGPDGNLWFTDQGATPAIGRITPAGAITQFKLNAGAEPNAITLGPDGNLWFTDQGTPPAVGRITPAGTISEFSLSPGTKPNGITSGPDGALWFSDGGSTPAIARITTTGAILPDFPLASGSVPLGIAAGPDGALWFADSGTPAIGKITTSGKIQPFTNGLKLGSKPTDIVAGPDGNLWFTDQGMTSAVGRVTTGGSIREFTSGLNSGSTPVGITAGADRALWFADQGSPSAIGRMTTVGSAQEFSIGLKLGSRPSGIGAGPDGNVWFTDLGTPAIGRITTPPTPTTVSATATGPRSGAVLGSANGHAQPTTVHVEYGPLGGATTTTREQNLGVTSGDTHFSVALGGLRPNTAYQARVVATNPTDSVEGAFLTFTTRAPKDSITRLRISPRVMIAAARGGPIRSARTAGAIVSYTGTQRATTTFTVQRAVAGRRQGRLCLKPNKRNRQGAPCTRYVGVGSFRHSDKVGANRFRFTGRVRNHKLAPGAYRLVAVPRNSAGAGTAKQATFKVKR